MAWTIVDWNSVSCNGSGKKCWSYSSIEQSHYSRLIVVVLVPSIAAKVVTIIINEYFL